MKFLKMLVSSFNLWQSFNYTPYLFYKKRFKSEINSFCIWIQVSRMYFFLLHLSLADILTAFFSLLPEILWTLTLPEFYGGNLLCRTMKFLQVSSSTTGNIAINTEV